MPDIAVAAVLVNAVNDSLDGVDLVRAHHHQLLFAGDQHHVAADHLAQVAFDEEYFGEALQMGDLLVIFCGKLIDGQEAFFGVEAKVAAVVVVGKIPSVTAVTYDEELHEAQQGLGVAIAGVVLVFDNLFHGSARADAEGFQLDLRGGYAVDKQDDIVAVMAVIGIDAKLVDHLKGVFCTSP